MAASQWRRFFHATRLIEGGKTSLKEGRWQKRVTQKAMQEVKVMPLLVGAMEYADRLKLCHGGRGLIWAGIIHQRILCARRDQEKETYLGNILVQTYGRCGAPERALEAFAAIAEKNVHSWTIMMGALQANDKHEEALDMFDQMVKQVKARVNMHGMMVNPGSGKIVFTQATYATALRSCAALGAEGLKKGKDIHGMFLREGLGDDLVLQNSLISMYSRCGKFEFSKGVFDGMQRRNVISYTAMVSAYSKEGFPDKAFELYKQMLAEGVHPDVYTFAAALNVCPTIYDVQFIHTRLLQERHKRCTAVMNSLVSAYARFGKIVEAEMVFDRIGDKMREVASWNAMIGGYARNNEGKKAIEFFVEMEALGVHATPNTATFTNLLIACAQVGAFDEGREAHSRILDEEIPQSIELKNALVEMYSRCGLIGSALKAFERMNTRDTSTYLGMMAGYTRPGSGHRECRLELYHSIIQEGLVLKDVDYSTIFGICKHTGIPDEGWRYFMTMSGDFGISPLAEHYLCMVELLARVVKLDEARELIENMPYEPGADAWKILLSACKVCRNVKLGVEAAHRAMELDPLDETPHVLLAGLHARVGNKRLQEETMKNMVARGLSTLKGKCTIEAKRQIHELVSGDVFHPLNEEVRDELKRLYRDMIEEGYQVEVEDDITFPEQEFHSERMAIGLGLVFTDSTYPLYIVKNTRMCPDCHRAIKFMTRLLPRWIIIRDPGRVHWFSRGSCSCGDYW